MKTEIKNWDLTLEQFIKKTRACISSRLVNIGHAYNRNITVKTYHIYLNTNTLQVIIPKSDEDLINLKSFSAESSENVKIKAYNFIIENMKGY